MNKKQLARRLALWIGIVAGLTWFFFLRTEALDMSKWQRFQDSINSDDWIGWIHPFGAEVRALEVGPFDDIEQCRTYAFEHLEREYDDWENAEYYCGYRCGDAHFRNREAECQVITK